ncbi:MAG: hypothetical protein ACE5JM_08465, partial [Armatimonadota bacterium]
MRVLQLIDHVFSPELFALFLTARCDMFDCRSLGRDFEIRQLAFSCLPDRELLSREGTETLFLPTPGQSAERIDAVLDAITTFEPHLIHVMGAESNPSHNAVASAFGHIPIIFSYEGGPVASEDALPFLESCTALVYFDEEYRELVPAHLAERVRVRQRAVRTDLFRRLPGTTR